MALWTPAARTTAIWLDSADAGAVTKTGDDLTEIQDKSGNARHGAPPSTAARPKHGTVTLGGLPVMRFDGTDDELRGACGAAAGSTLYILARVHNWKSFGRIFAHKDGTPNSLSLAAADLSNRVAVARQDDPDGRGQYREHAAGTWGVFVVYHPNNGVGTELLRINGVIPNSIVGNTPLTGASLPVNSYSVGSRWGAGFQGVDVAEMFYVEGFDVEADNHIGEGYLHHKWGITASLPSGHPYKDAAPVAPFLGRFYGTIRDKNGALAERRVIATRDSTGGCVGNVLSDPVTGGYEISGITVEEPHTLTITGESDRNALVFTGVMPEAIP